MIIQTQNPFSQVNPTSFDNSRPFISHEILEYRNNSNNILNIILITGVILILLISINHLNKKDVEEDKLLN